MRYIFNTPSDIQRNLQSQYLKVYGQELIIMFTKFSHDVLTGLVQLTLAYCENNKKQHMAKFKIYGTYQHYKYLQTYKYHLGQKVLGISYCTWLNKNLYRLGINNKQLYEKILNSNKFATYINKINWKIIREQQSKINDARIYLTNNNTQYEDNYMIIKPFFQNLYVSSTNVNLQKEDKISGNNNNKAYNTITNYLCFLKKQVNTKQNKKKIQSQITKSNQIQKVFAIISYQSIEQIKQILQRKGNCLLEYKQNQSLLTYLQKHKSYNVNSPIQTRKSFNLSYIIHVIDNTQLIYSPQFYKLFNELQNFSNVSSTQKSIINLFYGYGIKSQSTNIHYLMNTYYKGIRFYSICSKLLKYLPNITLNHYNYWINIYNEKFINLKDKIKELYPQKNFDIQVYKPVHELTIFKDKNINQQQALNQPDTYQISKYILNNITYPIFSNSLQYRTQPQVLEIIKKKSAIVKLKYFGSKSKGILDKVPPASMKKFKQNDPKIIFLGTNSKYPTPERNVSGILIEIDNVKDSSLILLDCGGGTYEQFLYHYSPQLLQLKLMNLKIIFMTHLHADHNLGVLQMIQKRNKILKKLKGKIQNEDKLFLIFPFNMLGWMHFYCNSIQNIFQGCHIIFTQSLANQKINVKDQWFESRMSKIRQQKAILNNKKSKGKLFKTSCQRLREKYDKSLHPIQSAQEHQKWKDNQKIQTEQNQQFYKKYIKRDGSIQDYTQTLQQNQKTTVQLLISKYCYKINIYKQEFLNFLQKNKIQDFIPTRVFHCPQSYGIVIKYKNGVKISYSGDCRPTEEFLDKAKESTIMIHQATFQSNQKERAIKKLHSTFKQAVQAGYKSKSETICLTHFGHYPFDRDTAQVLYEKQYDPQIWEYLKNKSIIACDHLQFNLSQVQQSGKFSKIISRLGQNNITQKNQELFVYDQMEEENM